MFFWNLLYVFLYFLSSIIIKPPSISESEAVDTIFVKQLSFDEVRLINELIRCNQTVRNLSVRQFSEWIRRRSSLIADDEKGRYLWDNTNDLEIICEKFNHRNTNFNFIYTPTADGLGNKLYSVITTVLMSLSVKRNYNIFYPQYNEIFDNCFHQYNGSLNYANTYFPQLYGRQYDCGRIYGFNFSPRKLIVKTDFLYYPAWLSCNKNDRTFFSTQNKTLDEWDTAQRILQLFLNPRKEVRDIIRLSEKILFYRKHRVGIQLRLGGQRAATHESYVGIPFERFPEVAKQIMDKIHSLHFPVNDTVVYISSDSTDSVLELRRLLDKSLLVVDFPIFTYGHSDINVNKEHSHIEVVNRILADFYFLAKSDYIFVTWQSSLGRLMCNMKSKEKCGKVLNLNKTSKT